MLVRRPAEAPMGAPRKLVSAADLSDKRIGVLLGSAHDTYATKTYPNAEVHQYAFRGLALSVRTGKVDAALYDEYRCGTCCATMPPRTAGRIPVSFTVGVGFNKNSEELRNNSIVSWLRSAQRRVCRHGGSLIEKRETRIPEIVITNRAA